jgi:hypothetical protein
MNRDQKKGLQAARIGRAELWLSLVRVAAAHLPGDRAIVPPRLQRGDCFY